MYKLDYTDEAKQDMQRLKHDEPKAFQKLGKLLGELIGYGQARTAQGRPRRSVEPTHYRETPLGVRNP